MILQVRYNIHSANAFSSNILLQVLLRMRYIIWVPVWRATRCDKAAANAFQHNKPYNNHELYAFSG
jgi:hypothetical protein